jgi:imidazole glycerol-phosphate synthase subunit HisF
MLRPRIIPSLLVQNGGLVKTTAFGQPKYVGDPINAVKIFNEKEADELAVFDIDATREGREPNFRLIGQFAAECQMPLCYGGGVTTVEQARRIIGLGVEKVSVSAAAIEDPELVPRMADAVGAQSVVVVLDVKPGGTDGYEVWTRNGMRNTKQSPFEIAQRLAGRGVGELVINSIDRDGAMKGYDLLLARRMRGTVTLPMTFLGGAGSLADIGALIAACGTVGAAAGSLFVFKGPYRAVLINYPSPAQKEALLPVGQSEA